MNELGIILDFKSKIITIDEVVLPMQNIDKLTASKKKALKLNNSLAQNVDPLSTSKAMQCTVLIIDAKYKKADLQAVVRDNCTHLSSTYQK